jgi:hypothetical protein
MFFLSNTHATLRENTFFNGSAAVAGELSVLLC